jgi:hypothetical protein
VLGLTVAVQDGSAGLACGEDGGGRQMDRICIAPSRRSEGTGDPQPQRAVTGKKVQQIFVERMI